ncbi:MAG: carbon monoxide dehydrogenase subunit G [Pseudomonadota bacterium]
MEITGEHRIPASRERVWAALHDPDVLKECITGCQSIEKTSPERFLGKVLAKVGPVKATFDADVSIENAVAPESYTLVGEGKGGVAGFAKGSADVQLAEDGADTILSYQVRARIGGKLAQLGSRLVDTTVKKYAADFFSALSEKLGRADVTEQTPSTAPSPAPKALDSASAMPASPPPTQAAAVTGGGGVAAGKGVSGWFWGVGAFAVVTLILIALS